MRDSCHVRRFLDEAVPREDIEHMVGVATSAVSACNSQVWRFIAIQDRELVAAMQAAVLERFEQLALRPGLALQEQKRMVARAQALLFAKAPLCIAVLATPHDSPMEELMRLSGITQEEHDRLCARPELQSAGAAVQLLTSTRPMPWATAPAGRARRSWPESASSSCWTSSRRRGSWRWCRSAARRNCRRPTNGCRWSRC